MKRTLTLLVLTGVMPLAANALETATVGSQTNQANVDVLNSKIDSSLAALQARLNAIAYCNTLGKFYDPTHSGADSNGCWANVAIPTGTIAAFQATACPTGWSEYTAARGKFLRGIDNGAGYDAAGTRSPGTYEADMVGPHQHYFSGSGSSSYFASAWAMWTPHPFCGSCDNSAAQANQTSTLTVNVAGWTNDGSGGGGTGAETRPRNIAVLFCQKS